MIDRKYKAEKRTAKAETKELQAESRPAVNTERSRETNESCSNDEADGSKK